MPDLLAPLEYPIGTITEFSGTLSSIPYGWQLCDGTNGTPDLHAKFLRGAPAGNEAGTTGGEDSHVLTISEMPPHTHTFNQSAHTHKYNGIGSQTNSSTGSTSTAALTTTSDSSGITLGNIGSGSGHENRPAFLELAYIMRMF